jgi:hypothetical protein
MSEELLKARMQKIAATDNYISGVSCYVLENNIPNCLAETGSGHDGITNALALQKAITTISSILPDLSKDYGEAEEVSIRMKHGFVTLLAINVSLPNRKGGVLTKGCIFVFAHKATNGQKLSKSQHNLHESYIAHYMVDQNEEEIVEGNRIVRPVSGLTTLLEKALEERYADILV